MMWASTKSPVRMLDLPVHPQAAAYLRANPEIDSAQLAADLRIMMANFRINYRIVDVWKRRLGLRRG